jgi:hypothetical protein
MCGKKRFEAAIHCLSLRALPFLMVFSLRLQGQLQAWAASPVPVLPIPQLSQTTHDAKDIFV